MSSIIKQTDGVLKVFALLLIITIGCSGIYAARGLYADGSFWLVEMLPRGGFFIFDPHRAYAQVLVQLPVAAAIWFDIHNLNTLIRLHSFGFVGMPLLFWLIAMLLHARNTLFWFFLMAFSVSYLRSNFFAAGEFSTAYSLTALCAAILCRQQINAWLAALLLLASVVLTRAYEATLFLGAFLAILTLLRLVLIKDDRPSVRVVLFVAVIIFLMASALGANSILFQRSYDGQGTANLGAFKEIHLLYLVLIPLLVVILCTTLSDNFEKYLCGLCILLSGLYLVYSFRWDHSHISFGYLSYAYRGLCNFLLLGVLSLAIAQRFGYLPFKNATPACRVKAPYLAIAATSFLISMAWPMLFHTYGFYKWAQRFETTAIELKAHTHIDQTTINTNHGWTQGYNWMWGNPSTSILLRGDAKAMILNNSTHTGPEPMDPNKISADPLQPTQAEGLTSNLSRRFEKRSLLFP